MIDVHANVKLDTFTLIQPMLSVHFGNALLYEMEYSINQTLLYVHIYFASRVHVFVIHIKHSYLTT